MRISDWSSDVCSSDLEENGLYRITDGTHTTLAAAGPLNPLELRDPRSTGAVAEPLVDESGGTVRRIAGNDLPMLRKVAADRDSFGRHWIGLKRAEGYGLTGVHQLPVVPAPPGICLTPVGEV